MSKCSYPEKIINETISFHGHTCPGLATGIRVAELASREIGTAFDEEVVCVSETDMCAVDAIQFLVGCTFGKGNLIHLDIGKNAFSFFNRNNGKSMRVLCNEIDFKGKERMHELHQKGAGSRLNEADAAELNQLRNKYIDVLMNSDLDNIFRILPVQRELPRKARILGSLICSECGERAMESRVRLMGGKYFCLPCFEKKEQKN